jgi:formylglycine-generating enzyme required for sulfatase activity
MNNLTDNNGEEIKPLHGATDPIVPIDFSPREEKKRYFSYRFRWLHVFLGVAGVVVTVASWFVLTARSVSVQVDPITADIQIEGGMNIRLGPRYLIRSGSYQLSLRNEGYHDTNTQLVVGSEQNQIHEFVMRKLPGLVTITTADLEDARVRIDGVDVGTTPLTDIPVEPGTHNITISKDRYLDHSDTIEIEGREQRQNFSAELKPAWAVVNFSSTPPGADILVDGALVGTTPMQAEIIQGRRDVTLKLAGHKAWQDDFDVIAGEGFDVTGVELEPADGLVFIRTQPSGASVTANGEFQGLTPLEIALPPGQNHQVTFFHNGYQSITRNVRTQADQEQEITLTLEPVLANVEVIAEPADAQLFVNGELRGQVNQTYELMAASQQVEIRREGYVPYMTEFTARPGMGQQIRVTLKSLEQARLEQIEPVIQSPAGQQLTLFYPGAFTMGASRREPGRGSNETLRDVELERPFYFSQREVSNAEYRLYDPEHNSGTVSGLTLNNEAQPVVRISWMDAALYCNWLSEREGLPLFYQVTDGVVTGFNPDSNGYRLPTEAEWEWVARTDGSGELLRYTWGDSLPPPPNSGNFADTTAQSYLGEVMFDYTDNYFATAPVASFAPNHHGIYDMAGNVAEWVHDFYGSVGVFGAREVDPLGPDNGVYHTIRGSSWAHGTITELRLSFRDWGEEPRDDLGFRVARYLE